MIACIGDVHGWIDRLEDVIAQLPDHEYWFTGDLVDRGPDSAGVVRRVRELCETGKARCVLGNHEYALVLALGCASQGIRPIPWMWDAWTAVYGGIDTIESYGLDPFAISPAELAAAMGDDLDWLADLPWLIDETVVLVGRQRRLIMVHAGLQAAPLAPQLAALKHQREYWWREPESYPPPLYDKTIVAAVPTDLPANTDVISGHTPQHKVYRRPGRVVVDTSGGVGDRPLSAWCVADERVVTSR